MNLNRHDLTWLAIYDGTELKASAEASNGQALFYRIRTFKPFGSVGFRVWVLGWRTKSDVHFVLLHESGETEEYSAWNTTALTYEPEWYSFEKP